MKDLRYIDNMATLELHTDLCVGCGLCTIVCPHGVFAQEGPKARVADGNGCMECGACARNCPVAAISVNPGVGCAAYIISGWIKGKDNASCGGGCC